LIEQEKNTHHQQPQAIAMTTLCGLCYLAHNISKDHYANNFMPAMHIKCFQRDLIFFKKIKIGLKQLTNILYIN